MAFGVTPLSTTALSTNQFPVSAVAEPGLAGGNLTALEGGPGSVDSNGNRTAPASMYIKGGSFIDFGAQADAAASTDTGTFSYMALFKRAMQKLTSIVTNTNAFASLGTDQAGAMIKVSLYGTNAVAGDTAFPINASGNVKTNISGVSAGVNFNPASVGTNGSAIPASSTLVGASDGTNLQQLLVESTSNRNLRTGVYNGANELGIDSGGRLTAILQALAGTALGTDQSGTELKISVYGTNATNGDSPLGINPSGNVKTNINGVSSGVAIPAGATASQVGTSDTHLVSAASNNATNIKATAGQVYSWNITNVNAAFRYVKLYNKATAPAPATDTPLRTIGIPPNSTVIFHSPVGIKFATGIGFATVTGISDTDNTSVGASDLVIDIDWL